MIDMPTASLTGQHAFVPEPDHGALVIAPDEADHIVEPDSSSLRDMPSVGTYPEDLLESVVRHARTNVDRYPDSARAYADLGLALLNADLIGEAVQVFRRALQFEPKQLVALSGLGRALLQEGSLEEAVSVYRRICEAYPRNPTGWVGLARVTSRSGRTEEALQAWRNAVKHSPKAPLPHVGLAIFLLESGNYHEAVKTFREAMRCGAHDAYMYHNLGVAYMRLGTPSKAATAYRTALTLAPRMPFSTYGLSEALMALKRIDESVRLLNDYLHAKPQDFQALELLAWMYVNQKRYRDARARLYSAFAVIQDLGIADVQHRWRLTNNLGVCYLFLKDRSEAQRMFRNAIQAQPDAGTAPYHNLVRLLLGERKVAEAQGVLAQCLSIFPHDPDTRVLYASALETDERYDEAIEVLRRVVDAEAAPMMAYASLGGLLNDHRDDPAAAIAVLQRGLSKFPDSNLLVNGLAYAHLMRCDTEPAHRLLDSVKVPAQDIAAILLPATRGLLRLCEGDIAGGNQGYQEAEQRARDLDQAGWVPFIQQKRHLEVARALLRAADRRGALQEVRAGLSRQGSPLTRRKLLHLADLLEAD